MIDKIDSQLVAHVSSRTSKELKGLAEANGTTPSEYLRQIIEAHIGEQRSWFEHMRGVFSATENGEF